MLRYTTTGKLIGLVFPLPVPHHPENYYEPLSLNHDGSTLVLTPPRFYSSSGIAMYATDPLIFWNRTTQKPVNTDLFINHIFAYRARDPQSKARFFTFSGDGKTFACPTMDLDDEHYQREDNNFYIELVDVETGQRKQKIPIAHSISIDDISHLDIALNNDGSLLAYSIRHKHENEINLINTHTGAVIQKIKNKKDFGWSSLMSRQPPMYYIRIIGFSLEDNLYIMTPTRPKLSLQLWNSATGSLTPIMELEDRYIIKLSADGRLLVVMVHPETIELFKRTTQTELDQQEREQREQQRQALGIQQDEQRAEQRRLQEQRQRNLEALNAPNIQATVTRQIVGKPAQTTEVQESQEAQPEQSEDVTTPAIEELD